MRTTFTIVIGSLTAMLGFTAEQAVAQNVLGNGQRLDASLQVGARGRNAPKLQNTYGVTQNALVTGRIGGGRGFRGDTAFGAAGDFSGTLPGDLVFQFQLNSAGRDFRNDLRRGGRGRGSDLYDSGGGLPPIYRGPGSGASLGQIQQFSSPTIDASSSGATGSTFTRNRLSAARPDAGFSFERNNLSGIDATRGTNLRVETGPDAPPDNSALFRQPVVDINPGDNVSGTEGFQPTADQTSLPTVDGTDAIDEVPGRISSTGYQLESRLSLGERLGNRLITDDNSGVGVARFSPLAVETTEQLTVSLDRLLSPLDPDDQPIEPTDDAYQTLLEKIRSQVAPEPAAGADDGAADGDGDAADADGDAALNAVVNRLDYDLAPLRTMTSANDDFLNDAMARGEKAMADGRYFDAEIVYAEALNLRPGYPLAVVGKVNAQVGAGLYMSAGRTMRVLFKHHPEMIAARYTRPLLPTAKRVSTVRMRLALLAEKQTEATEPLLLIAYLAYQTDDPEGCADALAELTRRDPSDSLTPLLRRIWLDPAPKPAVDDAQDVPAESK